MAFGRVNLWRPQPQDDSGEPIQVSRCDLQQSRGTLESAKGCLRGALYMPIGCRRAASNLGDVYEALGDSGRRMQGHERITMSSRQHYGFPSLSARTAPIR